MSFCLFFTAVYSTTTEQVFAKYKNKYFIETGSYRGDGIQMALNVGFPIVLSIELSPVLCQECIERFKNQKNVAVLQGDSSIVLPLLLTNIDAPATFWLDGHYSGGITAKGTSFSPILAELDAIANHPIKTHTILIDDVREFGKIDFDYVNLNTIVEKIYSINPDYLISFEDGFIPNDVLVARIPQSSAE